MSEYDDTERITATLREAAARKRAVSIAGGQSKSFYGNRTVGETLATRGHTGIVHYDPRELVLTARAGTPLAEIEHALAASGQFLPFEPPRHTAEATLGGAVASGLSGPARAAYGPLRDYVLGIRLADGQGRLLRFGGEVMKNVAGYDVSRLVAGSLGILGVLLEISLKVLPSPAVTRTWQFDCEVDEAIERLQGWTMASPAPVASVWCNQRLHVRYAGTSATLNDVARHIGGRETYEPDGLWTSIRDQSHAFFRSAPRLWRVHVAANTPPSALPCLVEWHGAQRWYPDDGRHDFRALARQQCGHATLYWGAGRGEEAFTPLAAPLLALHRRLKQVFDPAGILNPGRLYADL